MHSTVASRPTTRTLPSSPSLPCSGLGFVETTIQHLQCYYEANNRYSRVAENGIIKFPFLYNLRFSLTLTITTSLFYSFSLPNPPIFLFRSCYIFPTNSPLHHLKNMR